MNCDCRRGLSLGMYLISSMVALFCAIAPAICRADAATTAPSDSPKTGDITLTFTERSPLSTRKELGRRLNLKDAEMGEDYDLASLPYKAYVPKNYDPATPVGIFVYLGYKNTTGTPPAWQPILEKSHLIFISPICHAGKSYPPAVPEWQMLGMAFDAVENLRHLYAIDNKRLYQMSWNEMSTVKAFASSDVFTGFVLVYDSAYPIRMTLPDGRFYPPTIAPPPPPLFQQALHRGIFMVEDPSPGNQDSYKLKFAAMKRNEFTHIDMAPLSAMDDLHYPLLKADWFEEKVLPLLDAAAADSGSATSAVVSVKPAATTKPSAGARTAPSAKPAAAAAKPASPATAPTVAAPAPAPAAPPEVSEAQQLLTRAQLLINNNQKDLAMERLKQIITKYPSDPAAAKAQALLDQLNAE